MLPVLLGAGTHTSYNISVGFLVAYPYSVGNAKAWKRGMSGRVQFPRFFILCLCLIYEVLK